PAPLPQQVFGGGRGSPGVVGVHVRHERGDGGPAEQDERHVGAGEPLGERVGAVGGEQHDPVGEPGFDVLDDAAAAFGGVGEHERDLLARPFQDAGDVLDDGGGERVVGPRDGQHERDGVGAAGGEAAGGGVGHVAQFFDGPQDALAHFGPDGGVAVDDAGDGGPGDLGPGGDGFQRGPPGAPVAEAVAAHHVAVPQGAVLEPAPLGGEVDVHD